MVYGYVRVSTISQANAGESLDVQRRKIQGRALELGKTLDHIYVEEGVSGGKPLDERPQGRALLAAVKLGDTVICSKLDRMFRSADDALHVLEEFKTRKISLYLLDLGGDCTSDGIAKLVFTILSAAAEFERFRIRERVRESVADRRKRNLTLGGRRPPFGWTIGPGGTLRPLPAEQRAIRFIRRLRANGHSLRTIAQRLNARGITISHMGVKAALRGRKTT